MLATANMGDLAGPGALAVFALPGETRRGFERFCMLLDRLKSETLLQHQRIEATLPPPENRGEYENRLIGFLGFVAPWENKISAALHEYPEVIEGRLKAELLRQDLRELGVEPSRFGPLMSSTALPPIESVPEALGSMYVMEGSTLGGQFIVRELRRTLGLAPEQCRYFSSYGSEVGRRWQDFRRQLLRFSDTENDEIMVRSALQTFSALETWFSSSCAERVG